MTLSGGVQTVDGIGSDLHRCVETECQIGAEHVVVDRLGHSDDRESGSIMDHRGNGQGSVTADHDQGIES